MIHLAVNNLESKTIVFYIASYFSVFFHIGALAPFLGASAPMSKIFNFLKNILKIQIDLPETTLIGTTKYYILSIYKLYVHKSTFR